MAFLDLSGDGGVAWLVGHDEILTISHSAQSKEIFAMGALNAAVFLAKQKPGLYAMSDMLRD